MVARANALARGFSGVREELIELLLAALNQDVLPEIPSEGSVGASGDLVPLAHMAGAAGGPRPCPRSRPTRPGAGRVAPGGTGTLSAAMQGRACAGQRHFRDDGSGRTVRRMKRHAHPALDGTADGVSVSGTGRRTGSALRPSAPGARFSRPVPSRPAHQRFAAHPSRFRPAD